ncbi:class I SAM-dependent methyltransferase [Flammeovirga agarivorans]|uniref:Methyltransferase domain-containing protein n=1 Tax=Flammeovirga agarivorans TaxID=2726742 RepID=A0A7X8XTZ0_9BACT|nr:class I SAM-dependent methyltransferase [Flammeovirga agarivorans]NLR89836.1 methyltransferase domain-containing protein [Flammeovirga agarivorans]
MNWNAQLYNDKHAFVYAYGSSLLELLAPQPHESILDVGCGSGQLTAEIKEKAQHVVGFDYSESMIEDAKERHPDIDFYVKDASNFSFDESFDAVFSNAALHWVLQPQEAAECMYKALKPQGRFVIEMGGKDNVATIVDQLRASLLKRGYTTQAQKRVWFFPSVAEYAKILEDVGFRIKSIEHYDRPTALADEQTGVKDWLSMFGKSFFEEVPEAIQEEVKSEVQENVKAQFLKDGIWYADYKRLRVFAIKE